MTKPLDDAFKNHPISPHHLSIENSPTIDFASSRVTASDVTSIGSSKISDEGFVDKRQDIKIGEECSGSGSSSISYNNDGGGSGERETRDLNYRSVCPSKPHKGNDSRWDAVQIVKGNDGALKLGHFRLLKKLGFGDIGSVYLAELRGTGCLFALKVMDKGMFAAATCICSGSVSPESISQSNPQVLLALKYLHMMGVVYCDLKPENVLPSCTDPTCKLPAYCQPSCFKPHLFTSKASKVKNKKTASPNLDSRPILVAEPTTAWSMSFVGTHEYLAPEIIRGDGHSSAVDWWTFGIFLYELLHGKTPFKGNGNRETLFNIAGQPLKFPEGSTVSFPAKDLIRGLLTKDPQKRLGFKRGATEIKQHPFFETVNWALIRSTPPPQIPKPVDITSLDQTLKPVAPAAATTNCKDSASTVRQSGPYLDFEFF